MNYTYRIATPDEIPAIGELLATSKLSWPGPAATPYVAVDDQTGEVTGVFFKTVCFHAEVLIARPGAHVSASEFGKVMRADFEALATEMGHPITIYTTVQDNERARAAAAKNGLVPSGGLLYEITVQPSSALAELSPEVIEAELVS